MDESDLIPSLQLNAIQLGVLTTEHDNLQSSRSAAIREATGRTNLYLGSLSSCLIALSLLNNASKGGAAFEITAFILGPTLIFLGFFCFVRTLENALEDIFYQWSINRIRQAYTRATPELEPYLTLSSHDDWKGISFNLGLSVINNRAHVLVTTSSAIGVLNSVVLGALVGGLLGLLGKIPMGVLVGISLGTGLMSLWGYLHLQHTAWKQLERRMPTLFPTDGVVGGKESGLY
jgi:hypothetical protein